MIVIKRGGIEENFDLHKLTHFLSSMAMLAPRLYSIDKGKLNKNAVGWVSRQDDLGRDACVHFRGVREHGHSITQLFDLVGSCRGHSSPAQHTVVLQRGHATCQRTGSRTSFSPRSRLTTTTNISCTATTFHTTYWRCARSSARICCATHVGLSSAHSIC